MQGNFKPSTSFPFKQYDEKFGKYSSRDEDDEEPFSKYRYSPSSDDDNDEEAPSGKYNTDETSSKSLYSKQKDEGNDDHVYERQKTEEASDDTNTPKYREFGASYKAKPPKQSKYSSIIKMNEI